MPERAVFVACLGAALLTACGPVGLKRVDTARIVDAIKADEVRWNADYRSGDPSKVVAHYAPDAIVMAPGVATVAGSAAIKAAGERGFTDPNYHLTFSSDTVNVAASGDMAASHGTYIETRTDPKTGQAVTSSGSYVTVYKPNAAGVWKAVWDINTPGPPPQQQAQNTDKENNK
jgi:ketosteroid isomerase-like protein